MLVGCEKSGVIRDAFRRLGHDAYSCDFQPCERDPAFHFQCDVREVWSDGWDLGIFHPDCRYLSVSGLHWNKRRPERAALTEKALDFFRECLEAPIRRKCVENPISCVSNEDSEAGPDHPTAPVRSSRIEANGPVAGPPTPTIVY